LIEVMVSLGIMTVGAMAMVALQQHTTRSNAHARELSTAMQIAQLWVERLKEDGARWTTIGYLNVPGQPNDAVVLGTTAFLKQVTTAGFPPPFQTIAGTSPAVSNAFDFLGNDIASNDPSVYYCASFRPAWVYYGRALRVDVRVWWARESNNATANAITVDFPGCVDDDVRLAPAGSMFNAYHMVYLPTVIRVKGDPI